MLPGALAVRLPLFRSVDAGEPDSVLLMGCVEDGERIAVGDADDCAEKLCCAGCSGDEQPDAGNVNEAGRYVISPVYALRPGLFTVTAVGTSPRGAVAPFV